jgi:hypothetical protein
MSLASLASVGQGDSSDSEWGAGVADQISYDFTDGLCANLLQPAFNREQRRTPQKNVSAGFGE